MSKLGEPIVLDLAALPREQMGPFLILGLDKDADTARMEANWADRLKWARRSPPLVKAPLEDINWAREILNDPEKRIRADVSSLNVDSIDGVLKTLTKRFNVRGGQPGRAWQPLDTEKPLADYIPPVEVPDSQSVRASLSVTEMPEEMPAVQVMLESWVRQPLDPWSVELPR